MPIITHLTLEMTPVPSWEPAAGRVCNVRICLTVDERRIELREMIPDDDFHSRFEWLMKRATQLLLENIEQH
jgi:hypothetical protein